MELYIFLYIIQHIFLIVYKEVLGSKMITLKDVSILIMQNLLYEDKENINIKTFVVFSCLLYDKLYKIKVKIDPSTLILFVDN